jgi:hypothetical protein
MPGDDDHKKYEIFNDDYLGKGSSSYFEGLTFLITEIELVALKDRKGRDLLMISLNTIKDYEYLIFLNNTFMGYIKGDTNHFSISNSSDTIVNVKRDLNSAQQWKITSRENLGSSELTNLYTIYSFICKLSFCSEQNVTQFHTIVTINSPSLVTCVFIETINSIKFYNSNYSRYNLFANMSKNN